MEPFFITTLYTPNPRGEVEVSLSVESDAPIPENVNDMIQRYMRRTQAVKFPASEHLNIMLELILEANYVPEMSKQVTCDGFITGWMIKFHAK